MHIIHPYLQYTFVYLYVCTSSKNWSFKKFRGTPFPSRRSRPSFLILTRRQLRDFGPSKNHGRSPNGDPGTEASDRFKRLGFHQKMIRKHHHHHHHHLEYHTLVFCKCSQSLCSPSRVVNSLKKVQKLSFETYLHRVFSGLTWQCFICGMDHAKTQGKTSVLF